MSRDLGRKLILSLVLALVVYAGLALYSDWGQVRSVLAHFPWTWLPLVVGLTLVNYTGRMLRWHWYLQLLEIPIKRWDSSRIFGVGMLMVMTPGKAGEFLKSYMVKNVSGAPMSSTAPIILAERVTDGVAMLVLAGVGLFAFPNRMARVVAITILLGFLTLVVMLQIRPLALWALDIGGRLPGVRRFAGHLSAFYESSYTIFRPKNLSVALLTGIIFWAAEGAAYFVVLVGFGVPATVQSLWIAVFIFCISTVIGAVIAMPGGLGGVEGSLVALSVQLLGLTTASATAAALLTRFCTLWLGVLIGVVSFFLWPQLLAGSAREPQAQVVMRSEA